MLKQCRQHPRIIVAFFLVPILFNIVMWQNYPVSARTLLPDSVLAFGTTGALVVFGFVFGLFTSVFLTVCALSFMSFGSVLKNGKIGDHVKRHLALYAGFWLIGFTAGSFAGFLLIICIRYNATNSNIFFTGLQGFLIAGMGAGSLGLLIAAICASILDQTQKSSFSKSNSLADSSIVPKPE
jgi:hypothetical protein